MTVTSAEKARFLAIRSPLDWAPPVVVIGYPVLLRLFHAALDAGRSFLAATVLALLFIVPLVCGLVAAQSARDGGRTVREVRLRRLSYLGVLAPTVFVFLGVLQSLLKSPVPDEVVWSVGWVSLTAWAWFGSTTRLYPQSQDATSRWRVVHGVSGAVVMLYVLFHIANHLFGLIGPDAHAAVMRAGRVVYRAPLVEPVLVALFLFQIVTGWRLAWRWSARSADPRRVFQIASGLYLSAFILGHMNSVFIYARSVLNIDTDWNFATGAPTGMLYDAWNIRLMPHYALGVFFVPGHLSSGLRVVLLAHGADRRLVDRGWNVSLLLSCVVAAAIIAGMCGIRI